MGSISGACAPPKEAPPESAAVQPDVVSVQPYASDSDSVTIPVTPSIDRAVSTIATPVEKGMSPLERMTGDAARPEPEVVPADIEELRKHNLMVPVASVKSSDLIDSFYDKRGTRVHRAMDIMAQRGTPVLSVDAGSILKLHNSVPGGLTAYAADPSRRFIYMYGHLDRFNPAVLQGQKILRGDTIGYVGTTGNADPNAPHLHIAIMRNDDMSKWWRGTPLNPKLVLGKQ